jgi:hypothetical protein
LLDASITAYQPTFILSGFFFGNSGADYRVRNEVYYSSEPISSSSMLSGGSATFNTPPTVSSAAPTANDTAGISIAMTLKTTATESDDTDTLLFRLPTGTQFVTSTFVVTSVSNYFGATTAIDSTVYNYAYPQVYAKVGTGGSNDEIASGGSGVLTINNITSRLS